MYGWQEKPLKPYLVKAGTEIGQFRFILKFDRRHATRVIRDFKLNEYPGLYILYKMVEEEVHAYVGESERLGARLESHVRSGPEELEDWEQAVIISDGRTLKHSIIADASLRKYLEGVAIDLIRRGGRAKSVNRRAEIPELSMGLDVIGRHLKHELSYVLEKLGFAEFLGEEALYEPDKIPPKELEPIVKTKLGATSCSFGERKGTIVIGGEEHKVFVRAGTPTSRGYQITLRGTSQEYAYRGEGFLLINREPGFLVPLSRIKEWLGDYIKTTIDGEPADTCDIFVQPSKKRIVCPRVGEENYLDISEYQLLEE
mgnify:CR=1 FL=1